MRILLYLILCFSSIYVQAQTLISGKVTNWKGEAMIGVNISIAGTYDGGSTDINGFYSFETSETGSVLLTASFTGYEKNEIMLTLKGGKIEQNFKLKEKISKLKAVRITAGAFEASDEKQGTTLSSLDMVTTAGSNGDNFSALKTLPGAQQTNDQEGLFVRGGTGNETQTFIDGTRVRNPFGVAIPDLGARGRFNPFIFKGTIFSSGGYSALYGQALSSAVILSTIDLPTRSAANMSLSAIGVGGGYQQLTKDKKQSAGINYNYTNLGPYFNIIRQNVDFIQAPTSHQLDANYRAKIGKTGMLKFYGYTNNTNTGIRRDNVTSLDYNEASKKYKDEYKVRNNNSYGNLSYKTFLGKDWVMQLGYAISRNEDSINTKILSSSNQQIADSNFPGNQTWIHNQNFFTSGKAVFDREFYNLNAIRFGLEYVYQIEEPSFSFTQPQQFQLIENYKALFAETDIHLSNNIAAKIGGRLEHSSLLNKLNFAPRISAAYKLNDQGQFSGAYGIFYQNPDMQYLYFNTAGNNNLLFQRADHYVINYLFQHKDRLLRIEAYNKTYTNLIKTPINAYITNNGSGYARGIELFYRDKTTFKGIDYWVSYSYIDSKRDFLNYPIAVQPNFVANHVGSIVFKKFWTKYMFGVNGTYTYSSGRPYNDPNQNSFMSGRTIDYHNVGISLNYLRSISKAYTVFVLSINNPFNFKQVYGFNYALQDLNNDGQLARSEILPSARQFVFLGMFMSWGIDRSQEAINNNL